MRLLLLAGTPEAVQIGQALGRERGLSALASLSRSAALVPPVTLPTRIGGWGGEEAFSAWLDEARIDAVLDATHPFANRISARTARVCKETGRDYAQFLRPSWVPTALDRWTFLNSPMDAAQHIPGDAVVLLSTGRRDLDRFQNLKNHTVYVRVRKRGPEAFPFAQGTFLHRPQPISVSAEIATLQTLGVDWVVARNTGGIAIPPAVEAARQLELPVGMIRRPPQPEELRIQTVSEALAWVRRRL